MAHRTWKWVFSSAVIVGLGVLGLMGLTFGCGESGMMANCPMHNMGGATAAADGVAVVNSRCPIMGGKVNASGTSASLTREFNGQRVGFCCGSCPGNWDKLSDQQKQEKLDKVRT